MTDAGDREAREALAVLIANTRRTQRALPLTDLAKWLSLAVRKLGSYPAVADRIGLSPHMLRQFSAIRRLNPKAQALFSSRKLDSVDAVVHLAMLPAKEQVTMAEALAVQDIDTKDLRAAIRLRRVGAPGSISSLLGRVKRSKTKREFVAEFVVRGNHNRESILAALRPYVPAASFVRLEIKGRLGRLVLNAKGRPALAKAAKRLGVPLKHVMPAILRETHS